MKKAAKTFLIIGMILEFYLIVPLIIGILTIKRINNAKTTDELRGWGIASILLVSVLGGIFVLCIKDEELVLSSNQVDNAPNKIEFSSDRLNELKSLLDDGIIDKETYEEKRKKYLEDL